MSEAFSVEMPGINIIPFYFQLLYELLIHTEIGIAIQWRTHNMTLIPDIIQSQIVLMLVFGAYYNGLLTVTANS